MPDVLQSSADHGATWVTHESDRLERFWRPIQVGAVLVRLAAYNLNPPVPTGEVRLVRIQKEEGGFVPLKPLNAQFDNRPCKDGAVAIIDGQKQPQL